MCVSVAVVQAIMRKIRHVLQLENSVGTVESKDTASVCKSAPKRTEKRTGSSNVPQHKNGLQYVTTGYELSDDEYLFSIGDTKQAATAPITIGNTVIPVIIDSGVSVNVLDSATLGKLGDNRFVLRKSNVKIYPYGSETPLPNKGTFSANVSTPNLHTCADFMVVESFNVGSLLGKKTATALGLLQVGPENPSVINQITMSSTQAIVNCGVGRLKDYQLKIHIDLEVTPVAQPQRRVPFHVRKDVEEKL